MKLFLFILIICINALEISKCMDDDDRFEVLKTVPDKLEVQKGKTIQLYMEGVNNGATLDNGYFVYWVSRVGTVYKTNNVIIDESNALGRFWNYTLVDNVPSRVFTGEYDVLLKIYDKKGIKGVNTGLMIGCFKTKLFVIK